MHIYGFINSAWWIIWVYSTIIRNIYAKMHESLWNITHIHIYLNTVTLGHCNFVRYLEVFVKGDFTVICIIYIEKTKIIEYYSRKQLMRVFNRKRSVMSRLLSVHFIVRIICRLWTKLNVLHEYSKRRLFYSRILSPVRGEEGKKGGLSNIAEMECVRRQNDNSGCENVLSGVMVVAVVVEVVGRW